MAKENTLSRQICGNAMLDRSNLETTSLGRRVPGGSGPGYVATYLPGGGTGSLSGTWEGRAVQSDEPTEIQILIHRLRIKPSEPGLDRFDRGIKITQAVDQNLKDTGSRRIHAEDGRLYWLDSESGTLFDMKSPEFEAWFGQHFGMAAGEPDGMFRLAIEDARKEALLNGERIPIYSFAHYDRESGALMVSNGGRYIWRHDKNSKDADWFRMSNGEGAIFRVTPDLTEWEPRFGDPSGLQNFLEYFPFGSHSIISEIDQRRNLHRWLLSLFFRSLVSERMVLVFTGSTSTGKTSCLRALGTLLLGYPYEGKWEPVQVTDFGEDFRVMAANRLFLGIDNLEQRIEGAEDALCVLSTGQEFLKRERYTDYGLSAQKPVVIGTAISTKDSRIRREDLARRTMLFYPEGWKPEASPEDYLYLCNVRGEVLGSLMVEAAQVADWIYHHRSELPQVQTKFMGKIYANFDFWCGHAFGDPGEVIERLDRLFAGEMYYASETDLIVNAFREWFESQAQVQISIDGGNARLWGPASATNFYDDLCRTKFKAEIEGPKGINRRGFTSRLGTMQAVIESQFPVVLTIISKINRNAILIIDKKSE